MFCNKKVIIWDLDNTLYRITPEFADKLDEVMAEALVKDLGIKMDIAECKALVKQSYKIYRDGGEYFYQNHGISPEALSTTYHLRKPIHMIEPYSELPDLLKKLPFEQYIFTTSTHECSERILKHIGLYEIFKDRFYSVEDFGVYKKNESSDVYRHFCEKIGFAPTDCIFVDDSYSNLEFAKEIGMTTIRIFYQSNSAKDKTYIDAAFKGITECVKVLINCKNATAATTSAYGHSAAS